MMMLTKANRRALPKLYATDGIPADQKVAHVKFFDPAGRGTWYAVEFDGDDTFFGYVVSPLGPDCDEWGYFSLTELCAVRNRFGFALERDRHFGPDVIPCLQPAAKPGADVDADLVALFNR